jgi:uncharacterized protein YkwD
MSTTVTQSFTDRLNLTFTGAGLTSEYHCYAADLPQGEPLGLCIQLHGDAAWEFLNPGSTYSFAGNDGMVRNARYRKFLFVPVLAPPSDNVWWTNGSANSNYLNALINAIKSAYNIDNTRMWVAGFSGGGEQMSYWLMPNHGSQFEQGGGGVFIAGGGRSEAGQPNPFSTAFRNNVKCNWWVGEDDLDGGGGWNTLNAVRNGYQWYTDRGCDTTKHEEPGVTHALSGRFGPILGRYLDEAEGQPTIGSWTYTRIGDHPTVGNADLARWEGYVHNIPHVQLRSTSAASVTLGSGGYAREGQPSYSTAFLSIDTPVAKASVAWHIEAQLLAGGKVVLGGQERLPEAHGSSISSTGNGFQYDPPNLAVSVEGTGLRLNWDESPTEGVGEYTVYRRTPPNGNVFDPNTNPFATSSNTTYLDSTPVQGTQYEYQVFGSTIVNDPPPTSDRTEDEAGVESRLFTQHNVARTNPGAFGYGGLTPVDTVLWVNDVAEVCRSWSDYMAATDDFKHNPNFSSEVLYWTALAENIAYMTVSGYTPTQVADVLIQLWMDSTDHRNAIMTERYKQIGIGASYASNGRCYATVIFRDPTSSAPPGSTTYGEG